MKEKFSARKATFRRRFTTWQGVNMLYNGKVVGAISETGDFRFSDKIEVIKIEDLDSLKKAMQKGIEIHKSFNNK